MKKKQTTSLMIKAIMLLLALIIMIFAASLAWFTDEQTVTANGMCVTTERNQDFKIAVGFKNRATGGDYVVSEYTREFNLREVMVKQNGEYVPYDVFEAYSPKDVTGDGITLVRPPLKNKNKEINRDEASFSVAKPNEDYISFDLYIQCAEKCQVFLDNETKAYGLREVEGYKLADESGSTNFSPDAIVGALRVSFTDFSRAKGYQFEHEYVDVATKTNIEAPNALWIPRSNIRFDDTGTNPVLYTDIDDYMSPNASYIDDDQQMNTYVHTYYDYTVVDKEVVEHGYKNSDDAITTTITGLSKSNIAICDVVYDGFDEEGNPCFYGKVQINIWLEGCDSEARRAMNSGQFFIDFDIISKKYNS